LFLGCYKQKLSNKEKVAKYYESLDKGDYSQIRGLINDSVTIIAGDYKTSYDEEGFYEFFKWDSIFKTSYSIVELQEKNNQIIVTVVSNSLKYEFLINNSLTFKNKISFSSGEITTIEDLNYEGVDWGLWGQQVDSLVSWTRTNHVELDGFINDMTMKGAQDYVKAIKLYESQKLK